MYATNTHLDRENSTEGFPYETREYAGRKYRHGSLKNEVSASLLD
jgi:hypothetical protein